MTKTVEAQSAALLAADRDHALQNAVDQVAKAIRASDEPTALYWSLVVRAVENSAYLTAG